MLLAPARKWFAFGDYSNNGRNARTHRGRRGRMCNSRRSLMCCSLPLANVSPPAITATTGAMRARTDFGEVCFYVQGAPVRALCGDKVAARWLRQLHCARRCCRCAHKLPALLIIRPKGDTLKIRRIFTHSSYFIRPKGDTLKKLCFLTHFKKIDKLFLNTFFYFASIASNTFLKKRSFLTHRNSPNR